MVNTSDVSLICQFCLCEDDSPSLIMSPCPCSYHVHKPCLENWLNYKRQKNCDNCGFEFEVELKLKYAFFESIGIWLDHPRNRANLYPHSISIMFLNIVFTVLLGVSSEYTVRFLKNGLKPVSQEYWQSGPFLLTLMPAILLFIRCNVVFIETQIIPWYRWWQSSVRYHLKTTN